MLEIVHPDRPGGSRVPVQRTVLGRGSMDAARISRATNYLLLKKLCLFLRSLPLWKHGTGLSSLEIRIRR